MNAHGISIVKVIKEILYILGISILSALLYNTFSIRSIYSDISVEENGETNHLVTCEKAYDLYENNAH